MVHKLSKEEQLEAYRYLSEGYTPNKLFNEFFEQGLAEKGDRIAGFMGKFVKSQSHGVNNKEFFRGESRRLEKELNREQEVDLTQAIHIHSLPGPKKSHLKEIKPKPKVIEITDSDEQES